MEQQNKNNQQTTDSGVKEDVPWGSMLRAGKVVVPKKRGKDGKKGKVK